MTGVQTCALPICSVRPNGLQILKTRVPLGVIGIIFESRPNVTVDAATLCLKAGNVVILRGGKEAIHSNTALAEIMRDAVETAGLPKDIIQLVEDTSRETAADMMHLTGYLDVLIPRGGAGLIQAVLRQSTVPVIETGAGNCHVYVDSCLHGEADYEMAVRIIDNAKTQRPSVCNAIEGLIVHQDVAAEILPRVQAAFRTHDVTIYGDEQTRKILGDAVQPVTEELYDTEFNDYKITVKVVASLDEAMAHIAKYSTKHSECIITRDLDAAQKFQRTVDAAVVYVNASTRFTDGGEFGYGAHLIRVEFLPPVDRRGEVDRNEDLSDKFAVIRARLAQTFCKAQVVFAENERAVRLGVAVHTAPAVHGVACASDSVFKVHDACTFDLNHVVQPFVFKLFVVLRARVDRKRAVQLLAQHNACQLVRKRHRRHGNALRALLHAVVQPV